MIEYEDLWRGKDIKTDEWVYGSRITIANRCFILPRVLGMHFCGRYYEVDGFIEVNPVTLGKYIGIEDCDNAFIFGGDIVQLCSDNEEIAQVYYDVDAARFVMEFDGYICDFDNYYGRELQVLSNMFDHPEYLGREDNNEV